MTATHFIQTGYLNPRRVQIKVMLGESSLATDLIEAITSNKE